MRLRQRGRPIEPDELPADVILVSSVDGIGVEALPRVEGQQREEFEVDLVACLLQRRRRWRESSRRPRFLECLLRVPDGMLHSGQHVVLLLRSQLHELGTELFSAQAVELLDALDVLVAENVDPLLPRLGPQSLELFETAAIGLRVDEAHTREIPVEKFPRAGLPGTRLFVRRDDSGHRRLDGLTLVCVEERRTPDASLSLFGHVYLSFLLVLAKNPGFNSAPRPSSRWRPLRGPRRSGSPRAGRRRRWGARRVDRRISLRSCL